MLSRLGKRFWRIGILVLIVALPLYYFTRSGSAGATYLTAPVSRGPIVRSVIATGTVNPVTTVQVGSYVSGPIIAIYADFNAPVKAGQLIAKIDPRPFQVKVDESSATLANAQAQLGKDQADMTYKQLTYERNQRLFAADAVSRDAVDNARSVYLQARAQVGVDRANIQQQQANLHDAQVQLNYTNIVSPVDGTIVSRNVDVGQTVASSFQTPTLFLIAKDLTKMQVDTNVSESDIGDIRAGQSAGFTVDAFPGREFEADVGQVRQAPITVQNVVTYDVVVEVANPEMLLKPGMTANVTIVTARRDDVMRVPLQALRFTPRKAAASAPASGNHARPSNRARVWIKQGGTLKPVTITRGLDDGNNVEILTDDLKPGDEVVTDKVRTTTAASGGSSPLKMTRF
ncbi:MAG TPA: efflux RND transporter periplasmic adaptor subunit [Candidatus Binataceae bacterium]|jgi:HlyD family secretion protein|nr:efflux RND transporter periplasmic adaptor subunit [Candidatus Binataceae bacterium]